MHEPVATDNLCARPAGVDEAGRGPLAGPVIAAAVILDPARVPSGLADSKTLVAPKREAVLRRIEAHALAWSIGSASVAEIDAMNILNATLLAMQRAIAALSLCPDHVLVDGNRLPEFRHRGRRVGADCIIGGDSVVAEISAASIVAKVYRDALMADLDRDYPEYGFARHKGYATALHRERLLEHGPCPEHRRSFAPVSRILARGLSE